LPDVLGLKLLPVLLYFGLKADAVTDAYDWKVLLKPEPSLTLNLLIEEAGRPAKSFIA